MSFQSVVNDLKSRVDSLASQGQEVVKVLPDTLKQANEVVISGFESLVKSESAGAKDLLDSALAGFEKARTDGIMAVVASPIEYLPPKDKLIAVFNDTVEIVSKTGDELYKTFKTGFMPSKKSHAGAVAKKAKRTVKKAAGPAVKKAARTVKKAAAKVEHHAVSQ